MKGSLWIVSFFLVGLLCGWSDCVPSFLTRHDYTFYALCLLMFLVGVGLGSDGRVRTILRNFRARLLLIPAATVVGTFLGSALVCLVVPTLSVSECLAVGSGFGYYSLSSVFITQYKGVELGTIALTANVIRELFTLVAAPLLVRWFGPVSLVCAGGATTVDTTLPVIARYSGSEWIPIAVLQGILADLAVPFFVTLFCLL